LNPLYIFAGTNQAVKSFCKYLQVLFLSGLVLVTSSGYSMNRMDCFRSGKSKVFFGSVKKCCKPEKTQDCGIKRGCCKFTYSHFQTSRFLTSSDKKVNPQVINSNGNIAECSASLTSLPFIRSYAPSFFHPPSNFLLILHQRFLI